MTCKRSKFDFQGDGGLKTQQQTIENVKKEATKSIVESIAEKPKQIVNA